MTWRNGRGIVPEGMRGGGGEGEGTETIIP